MKVCQYPIGPFAQNQCQPAAIRPIVATQTADNLDIMKPMALSDYCKLAERTQESYYRFKRQVHQEDAFLKRLRYV